MIAPTLLLGFLIVAMSLTAYFRVRDALHPVIIFGPMLLFQYVYMPLSIEFGDGFSGFLADDWVEFAQWVNLGGVAALLFGVWFGTRAPAHPAHPASTEQAEQNLRTAAWLIGGFGVISYAITIVNVGGFSAAYGQAYGGGWSDSGYIRDGMLLTLPALVLMGLSGSRSWTWRTWAVMILFAAPLALQAAFGARRGPTFMAATGVGVAYFVGRRKRPGLLLTLAAGAIVGLLMLFLVSNRSNIYVGSEKQLDTDFTPMLNAYNGNEFVYGAGTIVHYDITQQHTWGGRYFAVFFIRPIPRAIWPDKYTFAARLFDSPTLEYNLGIDAKAFRETVGWSGAQGAAPGIVADMFVEFRWGYAVALFLIGIFHGFAWRRATTSGGAWMPAYALLVSLSVYLIMQTLEAMAFRFLLTAIPAAIAWRIAHHDDVVGTNALTPATE